MLSAFYGKKAFCVTSRPVIDLVQDIVMPTCEDIKPCSFFKSIQYQHKK